MVVTIAQLRHPGYALRPVAGATRADDFGVKMPELPEVETVRRGLEPVLVGSRFQEVEQRREGLRFPFPKQFVRRLIGMEVTRLERRAKYLLAYLTSGEVLAMHLGMSGRFLIEDRQGASKSDRFANGGGGDPRHDHVIFRMSNGAVIRYNDARRFGFMMLASGATLDQHKLFRGLGVEPLSEAFTPEYLNSAARNKSQSLKSFLMDQKIIAGLGNIYVCESLYQAGLSPRRKASTLATASGRPGKRVRKLVSAIVSVLENAVRAGGSTLRDHRQTDGSLGYFQHCFAVYGRAGLACQKKACQGTVQRIVQNGRSTFFCPRCQH